MRPEDEVRKWVEKARHDRHAAEKLFGPACAEKDVVAFHCQQAIEKLLKAYLIWKSVPFAKVHDLSLLLDHCSNCDPAFETVRNSVEPLTAFAVAFRYPGPPEPSQAEVESAIGVVRDVWTFVAARLPPSSIQP